VDKYLEFKRDDGLLDSTLSGYASPLHALAKYCPTWPPESETICDFLNLYRNGDYSKVTVKDYRTRLNKFFIWCIEAGHLRVNPMLQVPKFKPPTQDIDDRIIPPENFNQVIDYLEQIIATTQLRQANLPHERAIRDRAIIRLTYATGRRVREVAGLQMSKLDPEQYAAIILASLAKNKKRRMVCFGNEAQTTLLEWLMIRPDGINESVFLGTRGNGWSRKPITGSGISHMWVTRQIEAGIVKPHRFHDIRHSHITHSLDAGVPMHHVSAQAGHTSPSVTSGVYSHSTDPACKLAYQGKNPDDLLADLTENSGHAILNSN
jgi:site-specific recombinase XerD